MNKPLTYEEVMYDLYVESGGSNQCYQNGMWEHCGEDCTVYGSQPECPTYDEITEMVNREG